MARWILGWGCWEASCSCLRRHRGRLARVSPGRAGGGGIIRPMISGSWIRLNKQGGTLEEPKGSCTTAPNHPRTQSITHAALPIGFRRVRFDIKADWRRPSREQQPPGTCCWTGGQLHRICVRAAKESSVHRCTQPSGKRHQPTGWLMLDAKQTTAYSPGVDSYGEYEPE